MKVTIPNIPWDHIALHFEGPYPNGHCNLVAVDLRSRYPVAETVASISLKPTRGKSSQPMVFQEKCKVTMDHHSIPIKSENLQKDSSMKK